MDNLVYRIDVSTHFVRAWILILIDYSVFQRAWGGMYVYALRIIAKRCIAVSFYLGKQKALAVTEGDTVPANNKYQLISELSKTRQPLFITYYKENIVRLF